jgi:rhamnogalacturonan endolyase
VAKIKDDGSFFIPKVRSGNYDLFIWHEGIYGEFKKNGLFVRDGENLDVGKCILIPRDNGHLLWQLGEPNRTVTEFKNGGNFHQWDTYLRYQSDFPHGMNFKIGKSDPQKDWNYLQPAIIQGEEEPTSAGITFEFDASIPGDPLLTVVAGGRSVSMDILINGKKIGDLKITRIGLQHIRTVPFGELTVHKYPFDRSLLQTGANQLTLRFAGAGEATEETKQWNYPKWTSYIAYDFIRLEMVE